MKTKPKKRVNGKHSDHVVHEIRVSFGEHAAQKAQAAIEAPRPKRPPNGALCPECGATLFYSTAQAPAEGSARRRYSSCDACPYFYSTVVT